MENHATSIPPLPGTDAEPAAARGGGGLDAGIVFLLVFLGLAVVIWTGIDRQHRLQVRLDSAAALLQAGEEELRAERPELARSRFENARERYEEILATYPGNRAAKAGQTVAAQRTAAADAGWRKERSQREQKLEALTQVVARLRGELTAVRAQATSDRQSLQTQADSLRDDLSQTRNEARELRAQLGARQRELAARNETLAQVLKERDEARQARARAEESASSLKRRADELSRLVESTQETVSRQKAQLEGVQAKLTARDLQIGTLREVAATERAGTTRLEKELQQTQQKLEAAEKARDEARSHASELVRNVNEANLGRQAVEEALRRAHAEVEALQKRIKELEEKDSEEPPPDE